MKTKMKGILALLTAVVLLWGGSLPLFAADGQPGEEPRETVEADPVPDPEPPSTEVPETGGAEEPGEPETDEEDPPAELPGDADSGDGGEETPGDGGPADSVTDPEVPDESGRTDPPEETPGDELPEEEQPGDEDGLEPVEEEAAVAALSEEAGPVPEIDGNRVYANGAAITIRKEDGVCYIFYGTDGKLELPSPGGKTVFGGGKNRDVDGDTSVMLDGVPVSAVYGGGYSDGSHSADVSGDANIDTSGNIIVKTCGGGYAEAKNGDASARVLGTARTENRARGPLPEEGFTKDGHSVYGGGYAYSNSRNRADASVGAVSLKVLEGGATHFVRGGGYATATSGGAAVADVNGPISMHLTGLDVREVYSGGYADGAFASATAESIDCTVGTSEMMNYECGQAREGDASVSGTARTLIEDCPNLYAYVFGGGDASGGGNASIGRVELTVSGSTAPVADQWGSPVEGSFYGGGTASGTDSDASVGSVTMLLEDSLISGGIFGGGNAGTGANAAVGSVDLTLDRVKGDHHPAVFPEDEFFCTVIGGTGSTGGNASVTDRCDITVSDSEVEMILGGNLQGSMPVPSGTGSASLTLYEGNSQIVGVAHFDTVRLTDRLDLKGFFTKTGTDDDAVSLELLGSGWNNGDVAVSYEAGDEETVPAGWFAGSGFDLGFSREGNLAAWTIGNLASGDVIIDSEIADGAPKTELPQEQASHIASSVLTDREQEQVQNGTTVKIYPKVEKTALDADVEAELTGSLQGETIGASLDIQLFKKVGNAAPQAVPETTAPIPLVIELPEDLLPQAGYERAFTVIRAHEQPDGSLSYTRLPDTDNDPKTVTVLTDRFSLYVLAYTESEESRPSGGSGHHSSGSGSAESIWPSVERLIRSAPEGQTVRVNARSEQTVPAGIIRLLKEHGVILELRYPGGVLVLDGASMGEVAGNKVFYSFDELKDAAGTAAASAEQPAGREKAIPNTGR
ncbi:hypothetical protein [Anaerotruncus sp. DFI.9.16]|uniref:hypothetical protein n=1 Tax=Anaerotruncus TaxID=244127 RepID=UPI00210D24A9|nr:hypothetical protein [Anaerotruncus sp. DFI.9.16]MCQ4895176.1 hypothetical protein [Anaerotruncus sp. DFI.9.16]